MTTKVINFIAFDPLEQFEVVPLLFRPVTLGLTNAHLYLFFGLLLMASGMAAHNLNLSNNYDYVMRSLHGLVRSMVKENLTIRKQQYFAPLFYLFLTILFSNLLGLLPYSFTATSSFVITFFLALSFFAGLNAVAAIEHQWRAAGLFLPSGSPIPLAPFLSVIELISYVARVFSLSIRLFANMMSGHALLKILAGFSWAMLTSGTALTLVALFPWIIVTAIMFLELLIAFLQAYVFVMLMTLYINDVLSSHA